MAFAIEWLEKRALFPQLIFESPDPQTGIIIVVPAFDEPDITCLLDSLASCDIPDCRTEVIIVVNAPPGADSKSLINNRICVERIKSWKEINASSFFSLFAIDAGQPFIDGWGVGLARKTGMDEALRRFSTIGNPDGVIVSLDADCTVGKNYFTSLCKELYRNKKRKACAIGFEHPLSGDEFPDDVYRHIIMYELHMRYFYQAVRNTGYPYAFHTVGSAMACKASAYLKAGGMTRNQAGEDFYFTQKLAPQGGFFQLRSAVVHPSPRTSSRVPFGTGVIISKLMQSRSSLLTTYDPAAFAELKNMFSDICNLYSAGDDKLGSSYNDLSSGIKTFVSFTEWSARISEIKRNTAGSKSFQKRFFGWFNMLKIVRYLNHVHSGIYKKVPVNDAAFSLLSDMGYSIKTKEPYDLLMCFRALEKQ